MAIDIKHILKSHAYLNIPLSYREAYDLGAFALKGCESDEKGPLALQGHAENIRALVQSVSAMCALHPMATYAWEGNATAAEEHGHEFPRNAAEQIAGICAAIFELDLAKSQFGFLRPYGVKYVLDSCGMGGDLVRTANVSTLSCFIAAAGGIPICKHGSPGNADRHGSSDFVAMCGINTKPGTKESLEACIAETNFGYAEAVDARFKLIHTQTHELAELPHMNDIIGPITHPADPRLMTRKIVGVNHLISPRLVLEAYQLLNERGITFVEHVLAVRGFVLPDRVAGVDELSICPGGSLVAEFKDGKISEYWLHAEDFGLKPVDVSLISPPQGMSKGDFSIAILKGEISGPPLDMVLANAALLFYLDGRSQDLKECIEMAREIHANGLDYAKMCEVRERLPRTDS